MKDHLDISKLTFDEAIRTLYGPQLDDVEKVVRVLQTFLTMLPKMRMNTFYQQMTQTRFKYKDFTFLVGIVNDMDPIMEINRQCKTPLRTETHTVGL